MEGYIAPNEYSTSPNKISAALGRPARYPKRACIFGLGQALLVLTGKLMYFGTSPRVQNCQFQTNYLLH